MQKKINGVVFRKMFLNGAKLLEINKQYVDSLNVFPVPDGDTGTNMSLTIMTAAKELAAAPNNNLDTLCNAMSKGALRGARGNSGVILSQIFKGMGGVLAQSQEVTAKYFAKAMAAGSEIAYKAVTKPKEGTILTVIRVMAEHAVAITKKSIDFEDFLQSVIDKGEEILLQTPEMLPVLKKAGVVDAGGRGLLIIFQGFYNSLIGKESEEITFAELSQSKPQENRSAFEEFHFEEMAEIEFAYCTEFFVVNIHKKTTEADIDRFREKLMTLGDCVLVIGDLTLVKVHVHTNTPGIALQYALEFGEIDKIKIENMLEQNRQLVNMRKADLKESGMVAICAGEGLTNIFKDLLVDYVIEGGQTMNPSAEDIATAVDKVQAREVFVFPNNKNIILAAELAKNLTEKVLHVIPTKSVPEGLSAVLSYNPEASREENISAMTEAMGHVKAGMVTYAVRSTQVNNFDLKEGDIIGIDSKDIVAKGEKVSAVTKELVDKMMDKSVSNITLYFGNEVSEEEAGSVAEDISKKYNKCDVDIYYGGQPLYYFIVSLE